MREIKFRAWDKENKKNDESFSSLTFEETAKHILKDCVISNYFDMTEWRNDEKMVL